MYKVKIDAIKKVLRDFSNEMIVNSFCENTGGDFNVDFYILKNGNCISVSEEIIILGTNHNDYHENFGSYEIKSYYCQEGDVIELEEENKHEILN